MVSAVIVAVLLVTWVSVCYAGVCNDRGYYNRTDGVCNCIGEYHGVSCQLKYCPHGQSWLSKPVENNKRNRNLVPCSNMGRCDELTGKCACRKGYEGRACERMSCPTNLRFTEYQPLFNNGTFGLGRSLPFGRLPVDKELRTEKALPVPICSGHGRCLTLRDAGLEFNGLTLTNPPVVYSGWDADAIQGCVCDFPWTGFDCSIRSCEYGPDVTGTSELSAASYSYETFTLECQADAGFFVLLVLGVYTDPIPFDANPGMLKRILTQALSRSQSRYSKVGRRIEVVMEANVDSGGTGNTGSPTVCGGTNSGILITTIQFKDYIGSRPPMWLSPEIVTSSKTFGSDSQTKLTYLSSTPVLRFASVFTFTCASDANHVANDHSLFFHFGPNSNSSISVRVAVDDAATIKAALETIDDFDSTTTIYSNLEIDVGSSPMCQDNTATTTTITLYSDYGNIHGLSFSDSTGGLITMTSNEGSGTLAECSNNGVCNRETGFCSCYNSKIENRLLPNNNFQNARDEYMYKMSNSDGSATNTEGGRNDCSRIEVTATNCSVSHILDPLTLGAAKDICNLNGYCDPSTATCTCYDPVYSGINCMTMACPKGLAWWAEPVAAQDAHYMATCSNKGDCDHTTGKCVCEDGYSGEACQRKDCPGFNTNTGDFCSGNGWCLSMSEIAIMYGYSYGSEADGTSFLPSSRVGITSTNGDATDTTPPPTWDAHKWYECVCSNSQSFFDFTRMGNVKYPTVSGSLNINGIPAEGRPLPGYGGFDCEDRLCPMGNNQYNARYNTLALYTHPNGTYVLGADNLGMEYNYGGKSFFEEQLVMCTLATPGDTFQLRFTHNSHVTSLEIGIDDQRKDIKRKLEMGLKIGNITVEFPNILSDQIETACDASTDASTGGFVLTFLDALGDLPLLTVVGSSQSSSVTVTERVKGNKMSMICSGETGMCNLDTGKCQCDAATSAVSSNGTDQRGWRGDCGTVRRT